jgi:pimeloyl-ACP methyl ester carboxylesterase
VPRAELAGLLFSDADDPRADLRWHLSYLRHSLPPPLAGELQSEGALVRMGGSVDAVVFAEGARRVTAEPRQRDALNVLSLYRGDLCGSLTASASPAFEGWLYAEQERLRRDFRLAVISFSRWALDNSQARAAVEPLSRLVTVEPYFEEAHVLLVRSLDQSGSPRKAVDAYRRYERILRDELGASPDPSVQAAFGAQSGAAGRRLPYERFVSLDDVTLHVVEWAGGSPAIVAIHGSGMSAYSMAALGERLSPEFRFTAVDLRGSGFSDKPPTGYSLDVHAADVAALVESLEVGNPVLLGFSIGGAVATLAAGRTSIRGLILLDGVVGPEAFTRNAAAQVVEPIASIFDLTFGGFDHYLREWRSVSSHFSSDAERLLEAMVRFELAPVGGGRLRRRGIRGALEETWRSAAEVDSLKALAEVACPVLIVHGKAPWIGGRPYFDDEIVRKQQESARDATVLAAQTSNHPGLVRDPEPEVIAGIKRFVHGLDRC